jgi:hypothetical protein
MLESADAESDKIHKIAMVKERARVPPSMPREGTTVRTRRRAGRAIASPSAPREEATTRTGRHPGRARSGWSSSCSRAPHGFQFCPRMWKRSLRLGRDECDVVEIQFAWLCGLPYVVIARTAADQRLGLWPQSTARGWIFEAHRSLE